MATSSSFVANGVTVTRIDSQAQLPLISGGPTILSKSNSPGCGTVYPGDFPPANVGTNTVAESNRFPTGTLAAGVYKS